MGYHLFICQAAMPRLPPYCCFNCQAVVDWCLHLRSWALGLGTSRGIRSHARYQKLSRSFWGISKATRTFFLPNPEVRGTRCRAVLSFQGSRNCQIRPHPWNLQVAGTDWVGIAHVHSACVVCWFLVLLPYLGACSSLKPLLFSLLLL